MANRAQTLKASTCKWCQSFLFIFYWTKQVRRPHLTTSGQETEIYTVSRRKIENIALTLMNATVCPPGQQVFCLALFPTWKILPSFLKWDMPKFSLLTGSRLNVQAFWVIPSDLLMRVRCTEAYSRPRCSCTWCGDLYTNRTNYFPPKQPPCPPHQHTHIHASAYVHMHTYHTTVEWGRPTSKLFQ